MESAPGTRSWSPRREANRELFALDVTNPLTPTLLWDLQSSYDSTIPYAPVPLANNNLGLSTTDEAFTWQNNCRDGGTTACTAAQYQLPPTSDPGRSLTGPYNYVNLGASQSISVAQMRRNGQPVFAAFVATNEPGGNGVHVFAIDIPTGQKLWEWDSPYDTLDMSASQASGVGNTAPAGVTLLSKAGNSLIDTVYVGDDTGALWELDAASGLSLTSYSAALNCATGSCNYALSEAFGDGGQGPQPISTLETLFYVSGSVPANSPFANYIGQTLLAYGTGGTDTLTSLASPPNGGVHVLSTAANGRYQAAALAAAPSLEAVAQEFGVAQEVPGYPYYLSGQRVFGSIVATNDKLYFNGTGGTVADIDERGSSTTETGTTYALTLNATSSSTAVSSLSNVNNGAIGGTPAVSINASGQTTVVAVTDQKVVTYAGGSTGPVSRPALGEQRRQHRNRAARLDREKERA